MMSTPTDNEVSVLMEDAESLVYSGNCLVLELVTGGVDVLNDVDSYRQ